MADDIAALEETVKAVEAMGGTAIALQADVTKEEDTLRMARETVEEFGRIDMLINSAAFYYDISRKPFYELDPKEWDKVMEVNVKGPWLCTRAVFPYMKEQGKGSIINLASEVFFTGSRNFVHYVASKGGVIGLTRALAVELGPHGIRINAVAPGFTDTEASRLLVPDMEKKYDTSRTPLGRLEKPEDMAGAVVFLASDDSAFIEVIKTETISTICRPELDISPYFMYNTRRLCLVMPGYRGLDQGPPTLHGRW